MIRFKSIEMKNIDSTHHLNEDGNMDIGIDAYSIGSDDDNFEHENEEETNDNDFISENVQEIQPEIHSEK